jgi:hypothetical protein
LELAIVFLDAGSNCDPDDTKCGSPTKGATMAGKIPNQHNVKKVGKSLKEKRNEKHAKKDSKKGLLPE